jgi:hypothetical protein
VTTLFQPKPGEFAFNIVLAETVASNVSPDVAVLVLDEARTSASLVATHRAANRAVVALFDAAAVDDNSADEASLPSSAVGQVARLFMTDCACTTRSWLDLRAASVRTLMQQRVARAKNKGFDAVVWNGFPTPNVDATGFAFTQADVVAHATFLRQITRAAGMAVALGQSFAQVGSLAPQFDFAVTANAFQDGVAGQLAPFLDNGKAVFNYEIDDPDNVLFAVAACAGRGRMDLIIKGTDRDNLKNAPNTICADYNRQIRVRPPPPTLPPPTVRATTAAPATTQYKQPDVVAQTTKYASAPWPPSTVAPALVANNETEFVGSLFVPPAPEPADDDTQTLAIGLGVAGALLLMAFLAIALFVCRKSGGAPRREPITPAARKAAPAATAAPAHGAFGAPAADPVPMTETLRHPTRLRQVTSLGDVTEATILTFPNAPTNPELIRARHLTVELRRDPRVEDDYDDLVLIPPDVATTPQIKSWQDASRRGYEIGGWTAEPPKTYDQGALHAINAAYSNEW